MDIFTTAHLAAVVAALDQPSSFLLDRFFGQVQTEPGSMEIHFDIDKSKPRLTPFVHPSKPGRVVADIGFETKSFKPAYAKDKRILLPDAPMKRTIGETIGGNLSPSERRARQLARSMADQLEMLTRREEVMASEVLRLGQATITGEDYPTVVVNYGRDVALTVALTLAARWGEAGVKPIDNLETWAGLVQTKSGAVVKDVVMDPEAWKIFRADADVQKLRDTTMRGSRASFDAGPTLRGQGQDKARWVGTLGDLDLWVYQDVYVDDAGATQKMLPDYTVLLGGPGVEGVRAYGSILDEEAQWSAERYFVKSWVDKDPAVRQLLLQSAPLVVPYRPNATFCATVR